METRILREELLAITDNKTMKEKYIKTLEQARRWAELLTNDFPIKREDGSLAIAKNGKPIMKRKTFEMARLQYFEEFYGFGKEQRTIEEEALNILREFEEQEHDKIA